MLNRNYRLEQYFGFFYRYINKLAWFSLVKSKSQKIQHYD